MMIIGDPSVFALESSISCAYEKHSLRALGFFLIILESFEFGVRSETATMLACSFDSVGARVRDAGSHTASFACLDARLLADAMTSAIYSPEDRSVISVISGQEMRATIESSNLIWAPDGDQAFDDGSMVAQFDVGERVRLIGFKRENYQCVPTTLRDVWMDAQDFYRTLEEWRSAFDAEWASTPKMSP